MRKAYSTPAAKAWPQAIFLDRDGTINRERADYVKSWQEYEWLPGVLAALALLARLEVPILVVTNQSVVGRGIIAAGALNAIHEKLRCEATAAGGRIDNFLVCPHVPADNCDCRKPKPGLLLQAAAIYGVNLSHCIFVGDSITDLQASNAAGCRCILVRTGRQGAAIDSLAAAVVDRSRTLLIVDDLCAAAQQIMTLGQSLVEAQNS